MRVQHEPALTRAYWETVGGTLIEEYVAVRARRGERTRRAIDGVILLDGPREMRRGGSESLDGRDVICVQTKATRLTTTLLGQAIFSPTLIRLHHNPRSLRSVAVHPTDDAALRPILDHYGVETHLIATGYRAPSDNHRPVVGLADRYHTQIGGVMLRDVELAAKTPAGERHTCEAVIVDDGRPLNTPADLEGRHVTALVSSGGPGMAITGKALVCWHLLHRRYAPASVRVVICCEHGDSAIEQALAGYPQISIQVG